MMSRGSVIPLFMDQIKRNIPLTITNMGMTRFLMSLDESVDLVKYAFSEGNTGDLFVRKAPGASIAVLIDALRKISGKTELNVQDIGIRHGEKQHESLVSAEEMNSAIDCGDYFKIPLDTRTLDYQIYFDQGKHLNEVSTGYTSANTVQLTSDQVAEKIVALPEYIQLVKGEK
jgi:UDP-glucose 4-epimerase